MERLFFLFSSIYAVHFKTYPRKLPENPGVMMWEGAVCCWVVVGVGCKIESDL